MPEIASGPPSKISHEHFLLTELASAYFALHYIAHNNTDRLYVRRDAGIVKQVIIAWQQAFISVSV